MTRAAESAQVERRPRIGWCPLERRAELQEFIGAYWRRDHVLAHDRDLLSWQYRREENDGLLSVLLAREGEQLVGFLGLIPVGASYYGERVAGAWLAMWMTMPGERRTLTALALLREALGLGYAMIGCCGFNATTSRILQGLGFSIADDLRRWVRVVSPLALRQMIERAGSNDHPHGAAKVRATDVPAIVAGRSGVRLLSWSDDAATRWDFAWRRNFAPQSLGTWRDAAYLRWRYLEHPRFNYEIRFAEEESTGSVLGLVVYRVEPVRACAAKVLRIVEFLGSGSAGVALARSVIEAGEVASVAFADFYCSTARFAPALEAVGFYQEDSLSGFLPSRFQPLEINPAPLPAAVCCSPSMVWGGSRTVSWDDLYVTRSDGDQDRPN